MATMTTSKTLEYGFKPAVLGSAVGVITGLLFGEFLLAVVTGVLALLNSWQGGPDAVLAVALLSLVGAPIGCGVALRVAGKPGALVTAVLMLGLLITVTGTVAGALGSTRLDLGASTLWSLRLPVVLGIIVTAGLARGLVVVGMWGSPNRRTPSRLR